MKIFKQFKEFAVHGNATELAIGIIIGGAFGKIVSSLVTDIIMPPIGFFLRGVDFKDMKFVMHVIGSRRAVTINYGNFIQVVIDFLIVAFSVFLIIKAINTAKKRSEKRNPKPESTLSKEEILLTEIRDLLKEKK